MNQAILLSILCLCIACSNSHETNKPTNLQLKQLKGQIKTVTDSVYGAVKVNGSWQPKGNAYRAEIDNYDINGNIIETVSYSIWDSTLQAIAKTEYEIHNDTTISRRYTFSKLLYTQYDIYTKGLYCKTIVTDEKGNIFREETIKYDNNYTGRKLEGTIYHSSGSDLHYKTIEANKSENLKIINQDGTDMTYETLKRDATGNPTLNLFTDPTSDGPVLIKTFYQYYK